MPSEEYPLSAQKLEESRIEVERMHDVLLLLDSLIRREEAAVKLILGCLYDVGAVNLINSKFQFQLMNHLLKRIAKLSKPAFKVVAYYWFKKNCPDLITKWLHSQVKFEPTKTLEAVATDSIKPIEESHVPAAPDPRVVHFAASAPVIGDPALDRARVVHPAVANSILVNPALTHPAARSSAVADPATVSLDFHQQEIQRLNGRVKVLAALLIGVTVSLGGAVAWSAWRTDTGGIQPATNFHKALSSTTARPPALAETCD